jgi:ribonuclease I
MQGLFKNISVSDARWLGALLSQLTQQQIEDAFRSANYTPDQVRLMTGAVRKRIGELNGLTPNSQVARRMRKSN